MFSRAGPQEDRFACHKVAAGRPSPGPLRGQGLKPCRHVSVEISRYDRFLRARFAGPSGLFLQVEYLQRAVGESLPGSRSGVSSD